MKDGGICHVCYCTVRDIREVDLLRGVVDNTLCLSSGNSYVGTNLLQIWLNYFQELGFILGFISQCMGARRNWQYQSRWINTNILHLSGDLGASITNRSWGYNQCYVLRYPLTTGAVVSKHHGPCSSWPSALYRTAYIGAYLCNIITPLPSRRTASMKFKGVYTGFTLRVCPSVHRMVSSTIVTVGKQLRS